LVVLQPSDVLVQMSLHHKSYLSIAVYRGARCQNLNAQRISENFRGTVLQIVNWRCRGFKMAHLRKSPKEMSSD